MRACAAFRVLHTQNPIQNYNTRFRDILYSTVTLLKDPTVDISDEFSDINFGYFLLHSMHQLYILIGLN